MRSSVPIPYIPVTVFQPDIETICHRVKSKELILTPKVQREPHLWGVHQQSRLIETLFMGLPVPPVFVARDPSAAEADVVIDGVQRLSTINDFIDSKFALCGLQYRPDLEGKKFKDLSPLEQRAFLRAELHVLAVPTTSSLGTEISTILNERLNSR